MKKVDSILKSFRKTINRLDKAAKEAGDEMESKNQIVSNALAERDAAAEERKKAMRVQSKLAALLDEDSEDLSE